MTSQRRPQRLDRDVLRQVVTVMTYVGTVAVNAAAVVIPLGGQTTAQLSDRFPALVVPADYVFSIWSVIYVLLLAFTVTQALPGRREDPTLRRLGYLPSLAGVLNAMWVVLWQYQVFVLTVPVMVALLVTLIGIWLRLREPGMGRGRLDGWLVVLPFSVYLGWITVATIANVSQQLYGAGFRGGPFPEPAWAVAVLLFGFAIAAVMVGRRRDVAYGAVIVWAYVGIAVKQVAEVIVAVAALGMALTVLGLMVLVVVRSGRLDQAAAQTS
jgi:hypothetical protein